MPDRTRAAVLVISFALVTVAAAGSEQKLKLADHGYASMGPLAGGPAVEEHQVPVAVVAGLSRRVATSASTCR